MNEPFNGAKGFLGDLILTRNVTSHSYKHQMTRRQRREKPYQINMPYKE
jgi:hypothetical protein